MKKKIIVISTIFIVVISLTPISSTIPAYKSSQNIHNDLILRTQYF